jgi:AmmeMemoRadiSam system protein B
MALKKPRFAGSWYPASGRECERTFAQYEDELQSHPRDDSQERTDTFHGGIVPHAGWYFSGKTAYSVFSRIASGAEESGKIPDLVFVFGMHLAPGSPQYLFMDDGFETPLGAMAVDREAASTLATQFDFIRESAADSVSDNTIELQLPFIKHLFPEAMVVTIGVSPDEKALSIGKAAFEIAEQLGRTPCFIGSTDLTHYGPNYGFSPKGLGSQSVSWVKDKNDREIVASFLKADPGEVIRKALASHNACCPGAAAAAISAVCRGGIKRGVLVDYTTSYDRHPDSSFVGYAGVVY